MKNEEKNNRNATEIDVQLKLTNFPKMILNSQNTVKTAFSEFLAAHTRKPGVKMTEKLRKLSYDAYEARKLNVPD